VAQLESRLQQQLGSGSSGKPPSAVLEPQTPRASEPLLSFSNAATNAAAVQNQVCLAEDAVMQSAKALSTPNSGPAGLVMDDFMISGFPNNVDFSTLLTDGEWSYHSDESDAQLSAAGSGSGGVNIGSINFSGSGSASPDNLPFSQDFDVAALMQCTAFADDFLLEVPALKVLKAGIEIANRLGCQDSMWDPTAKRMLDPYRTANLPLNLQPTTAQQRIPHHPMIDILPWPSVRTKLICAFSLPEALRPPNARDSFALIKLVSDIEDSAEGCRIDGEEGFDGENWEVGQVVVSNWWWALDQSIIDRSNELRAKRGAPRLALLPE
jgi:hypothetical protein